MNAFRKVEGRATQWMKRYGVASLRISLGIVFLWFGVLKFFPSLSPAESLAKRTIGVLSMGMVPPGMGIHLLAAWECAVGIGLLAGKFMRTVLLALAIQMVGAMSPVFLFPDEVFVQVPFVPTLEGQYIIKNLVLLAAAIVLAATIDLPPGKKLPDTGG